MAQGPHTHTFLVLSQRRSLARASLWGEAPWPFPRGGNEGRCSAFLPLNDLPPAPASLLPAKGDAGCQSILSGREHHTGPDGEAGFWFSLPSLPPQGSSTWAETSGGVRDWCAHRHCTGWGQGAPLPVCCPAAGAGFGESLQGGCPTVGGSSSGSGSGWKGTRSPARRCCRATGEDEEGTVRPTHGGPGPSHQDPAQNGTRVPKLPTASSTG